jgi:hypothetical protein
VQSASWVEVMTPGDPQEEMRKNALTAFLEARVDEGFRIETRADTHAIIVPADRRWSFLERLRKAPERHVISVDEHGQVTMAPAEPLRT